MNNDWDSPEAAAARREWVLQDEQRLIEQARAREGQFPNEFQGKPAVFVTVHDAWTAQNTDGRLAVEMYATAPIGTEVWLRSQVWYPNVGSKDVYFPASVSCAGWQCLAVVINSEAIGQSESRTYYRTTFQLAATPEIRDDYPGDFPPDFPTTG